MSKIPYLDLNAQYHNIKNEIDAAISQVLNSGNFVLGDEVAEFEANYANFCQTDYCVAVNSGTSALHLSLLALGIGPDDEVVTVSMTFVATVAAILYVGAKPVLIDVDPHTWNMNPEKLQAAITPRTKAIIPVHLHGQLADMDAICAIAKKYNLYVIEDACQAHGAMYKNKRAGSFGDISTFSFYPGKNLGALGEGGGVVTNQKELAEKIYKLRNFGQEKKYCHELRGFNCRLETLQAAILNVKLKYLEHWTKQRRQIAQWYRQELNDLNLFMPIFPGDSHVYHIFAIRIANRDDVQKQLQDRGIITNIHYPIPVHLQPAYKDHVIVSEELAVSEQVAKEFLSLPIYPELTFEQVRYVCEGLREVLSTAAVEM